MKKLTVEYVATTESRELALFVCNSSFLYKNTIVYAINNLAKKLNKGIYDAEKAVILMEHVAKKGAEIYVKEFGGTVKNCFPRQTRILTAKQILECFADEINEKAEMLKIKR